MQRIDWINSYPMLQMEWISSYPMLQMEWINSYPMSKYKNGSQTTTNNEEH